MALIEMGEWIDRYGDSLFDAAASTDLDDGPEPISTVIRVERAGRSSGRATRGHYREDVRTIRVFEGHQQAA